MPRTAATVVAQQAALIATAWSPSWAPASWSLIAAQLGALRDEPRLQAIAGEIEPERLPALLFTAAATYLVLDRDVTEIRDQFPTVGLPQPPLKADFAATYTRFCLDHRSELLELCAAHRYQMNEVGRCADLVPALPDPGEETRELAIVDVGTGAGLALHLDRYRYTYRRAARERSLGEPDAAVAIETELRGSGSPPLPARLPRFAQRIGIDVEPLDVRDSGVRAWLAACVPQEIGAVTRFHEAAAVAAANPATMVRGEVNAVLPDVLRSVPDGPLICLVDTYANVFLGPEELERFRAIVAETGARRDLDWISIDPLVPLGPGATRSVAGIPVPPGLIARNRDQGVFGLIARVSYRGGRARSTLLGVAHPGAAWLEWLGPSA